MAGDETGRDDAERLLTELERTCARHVELGATKSRSRPSGPRDGDRHDGRLLVRRHHSLPLGALKDQDYLTPETLRSDYLDGGGTVDLAVPINSMMIATFFLVIMDTSFRITRWLQSEVSDWERTMVIIAGQQGRPTAGVTLSTNSVATMISAPRVYELPSERIYLAPHAPTFDTPVDGDLSHLLAMEGPYRELWCRTRAHPRNSER